MANTAEDQQESLVDKLKGGDYKDMVKMAEDAQEAQTKAAQMCLKADGRITKENPMTAFAGVRQAGLAVTAADGQGEQDELKILRRQRMEKMRMEQAWKKQGHGSLRELANEVEFVEVIQPHERALVLLDDGKGGACDEVNAALAKIATRHMETQFCRLPVDRARFLTHMVELEGFPTIFVLSHGEVSRALPPRRLFEFCSASSPLFGGHLTRMLHKIGAILNSDGAESDDDDGSDGDDKKGRAGKFMQAGVL